MGRAVDVVFANDRKIPSKLTKKERRAEKLAKGNYFDFEAELPGSFLPEIVRICRESGVQLVLMRMRTRRNAEFPEDRSHFPEALRVKLPEYEKALAAYLASESIPLLDFSEDARIPFEWFANGDHLNRDEARDGFTRLLAREFQSLGL
jgi:lysophospholipase L1-like esterase